MNPIVTRARRQQRRARLAAIACLLWLLGVEVLPAIHEGTHAASAPHRHDVGGMVVTVSFDEPAHRHADGSVHVHAAGAHGAKKARRTEGVTRLGEDGHRADGLAHHAAAIHAAAPPVTDPARADLPPTILALGATAALVSLDPLAANARGPPILA